MKKILVVLLAILVTGGLFAQITFTGDVKSGLNITQTDADKDDTDPKVKLWNDDAGHRFYLEGKMDFEDNFGVAFGLVGLPNVKVEYTPPVSQGNPDPDAMTLNAGVPNLVKFDYARLYGEFLDDMLRLTVGKGTGGVWGSGGKADKGFDDTTGIKLEVKPIAGLDVGFQLRTELDGSTMTVEQWLKETVIGAKYEMANLFSAVVAFGLDSDYEGAWYGKNDYDVAWSPDPADPTKTIKGDEGKQMRALLGVNVKVVPNLTAILDGYVLGLGDLDKYGVAAIGQKVGYQITPEFYAGVGAVEKLNLRGDDYKNKDASGFRLTVEPEVSYKLSDLITLNLNIPFSTGWTEDAVAKEDLSYEVAVKPQATFTLNTHASIATFYKLNMKKLAGINGAADPDAVTSHQVQVNFGWTF